MADVTGYTANYIDQELDNTVISGKVVNDNLILETRDGTEINAGDVRGAQGYGSAEIHNLSEIGGTPATDDEIVLYDLSAGVNKKSYFSRLYDFVKSRLAASSGNDDVLKIAGTISPINPNKINMTYADGKISTVNVRNNADSANVMVATMSYSDETLASITVVAGGSTVVYTLNYTEDALTSITKVVS